MEVQHQLTERKTRVELKLTFFFDKLLQVGLHYNYIQGVSKVPQMGILKTVQRASKMDKNVYFTINVRNVPEN